MSGVPHRAAAPARARIALGRAAAAIVAGAIGALSFAPWTSASVQLVSLAAALLLAQRERSLRSAALAGYGWGLGCFGAGLAWLYVSMHRYGGMPAPLAAAAVLAFSMYLALFPALAFALGGAALRASGGAASDLARALRFAGAWTLAEWLRGTLLTGFPWLALGYAHIDAPAAGIAPWLGVYGVGTLAAAMASLLATLAQRAARLARAPGVTRAAIVRAGAPSAVAIAAILAGSGALGVREWATPHGTPITVRLVQGNVPQNLKFDPQQAVRNMNAYAALVASAPADLTVLPETAWTVPWAATPPETVRALFAAGVAQGPVAIGMPLEATSARGEATISNSVALVSARPPHAIVARYDKRHLVPFGEFVPAGFRWFVDLMRIPLGDFGRGAAQQPSFAVSGQRLSFNVCYEDLFGEELIDALLGEAGATVLVNVSNIAWFGNSHALPQHLQISRMRARETARPMLRATNTGVTAAIDHHGRVQAALAPYTVGVLAARVQGTDGLTPYARWGNLPALALAALLLAVGAHATRTPRDGGRSDGAKR